MNRKSTLRQAAYAGCWALCAIWPAAALAGPPAAPAYMCENRPDECPAFATRAGVPYGVILGFLDGGVAYRAGDGRFGEVVAALAAKPGDPALLVEKFMLVTEQDDDIAPADLDALDAAALKAKDPLLQTVALFARISQGPLNREGRDRIQDATGKAVTLAEGAASLLPNDDLRRLFIGSVYARAATYWGADTAALPGENPLAKKLAWIDKASAAFAARWQAEPQSAEKLIRYIAAMRLTPFEELYKTPERNERYIDAQIKLVALRPDDVAAALQLANTYINRGNAELQRSERDAARADAARARAALAPFVNKSNDGTAFNYLSPALLEAACAATSRETADILFAALDQSPADPAFRKKLSNSAGFLIANAIGKLYEKAAPQEREALRSKVVGKLEAWDAANGVSTAGAFQGALAGIMQRNNHPAEALTLYHKKLDGLLARPIGDNLADFFTTIGTARKLTKDSKSETDALIDKVKLYVNEKRIAGISLPANNEGPGQNAGFLRADMAATLLHDLAKSLDSENFKTSAETALGAEWMIRLPYLRDDAPSSFVTGAAESFELRARIMRQSGSSAVRHNSGLFAYLAVEQRHILLNRRPFGYEELYAYGWALRELLRTQPDGKEKQDSAAELERVVTRLLDRYGSQSNTSHLAAAFYTDRANDTDQQDRKITYNIKALDIIRDARRRFGDDEVQLDDITVAAMNIAGSLKETGQKKEAMTYYLIAREASDKDYAADPADIDIANRRSKLLTYEAILAEELGDYPHALNAAELRIQMATDLKDRGFNVDQILPYAIRHRDQLRADAQKKARQQSGKSIVGNEN